MSTQPLSFTDLPMDVVFEILPRCSPADLGRLAEASPACADLVSNYDHYYHSQLEEEHAYLQKVCHMASLLNLQTEGRLARVKDTVVRWIFGCPPRPVRYRPLPEEERNLCMRFNVHPSIEDANSVEKMSNLIHNLTLYEELLPDRHTGGTTREELEAEYKLVQVLYNVPITPSLDLHDRGLTVVPSRLASLPGGASIRQFYLRNNRIREFPPSVLNNLTGLEILDLSNNDLRELPSNLDKLGRLAVLDVSGNPNFSESCASIIERLPSLQRLCITLPQDVELSPEFARIVAAS